MALSPRETQTTPPLLCMERAGCPFPGSLAPSGPVPALTHNNPTGEEGESCCQRPWQPGRELGQGDQPGDNVSLEPPAEGRPGEGVRMRVHLCMCLCLLF